MTLYDADRKTDVAVLASKHYGEKTVTHRQTDSEKYNVNDSNELHPFTLN